MKKFLLMIMLFLFATGNLMAQGSDVIICIDNSGSINRAVDGDLNNGEDEFVNMGVSIRALITNVLLCNPANRVAVTHYGATNGITPEIFIESNFTSNLTIANNFQSRLSGGDFYHESLGLIGNALDNVNNVNITSPQRILTRSSTNSLVIFLFTDAYRSTGNSFLVNSSSSALNSNLGFQNFTNFKNNRGATFVVVHKPDDIPDPLVTQTSTATRAAASIASRGGTFNGAIEGYPLDPDGNNLPRLYLQKTNFIMTAAEITTVSQNICQIAFVGSISLNSVNENCPLFPQQVTGSFSIPVGAIASNITLQVLNSSGAVISTLINPIITGNTFAFSLNQINFGIAPISGNFELKVTTTVTQGTTVRTLTSTSSNAGADVSFNNCSVCCVDCCVDNQTLSSPVLANFVDTRQANLRIHAVNTIENGAFASYHAGDHVLLKNGFASLLGSRVHIYNEGCTGTYILKQSTPEINTNLYPNGFYSKSITDVESIKTIAEKPVNVISISPNPNNGIFKISLNDVSEGTIQVTDMFGFTIYKSEFKNQTEFEMNMQEKPKGIYIVKVTSGEQVFTSKIIKN